MALFAPEPCTLHAYRGTSASSIIVPTPTLLFALTCDNANAGVRYIQFHNSRVALVSGVTVLGDVHRGHGGRVQLAGVAPMSADLASTAVP